MGRAKGVYAAACAALRGSARAEAPRDAPAPPGGPRPWGAGVVEALRSANAWAHAAGKTEIGTAEMLLALEHGDRVAAELLEAGGMCTRETGVEAPTAADAEAAAEEPLPVSRRLAHTLARAERVRELGGHPRIESPHVLLALIEEPDCSAAERIESLGADREAVRAGAIAALDASRPEPPPARATA